MDRKMRSLSNSTSSSSLGARNRASTSTTASSSTSSSSSSSSVSSSSDSETSTSQASSVKSATMGSTDSDAAKPPNKKARVLNDDPGLGKDKQKMQTSKKLGKPISGKPDTADNIRTSSRRSKASISTKTKENSSTLATQTKSEFNGTLPRPKPLGSVSNIDKPGKKTITSVHHSEAESSDYDKGKVNAIEGSAKKHTRSYSDIKSKYLTYSEESESDTKHNISCNSAKVKPGLKEERCLSEVLIKEQRCPLRDCDSLGHLGGHLPKHFTKEACPMYHNQTVQECEAAYLKRQKNMKMGQTAADEGALQTRDDHKNGKNNKELRIVLQDYMNIDQQNIPDSDEAIRVNREPKLVGITPEHDVHLFREAQAIASESVEQDQNLPYAMGTRVLEIGRFNLQVWYQSPYPEEYAHAPKLYICEYCLHYMKSSTTNRRHTLKCVWRHPPGEEIYRSKNISIWEVDGKKHREYCQNLCLFAKFFLDHKTLHDNVEPFFFYVMTMADSNGCHAVGYFSKEKNSINYNVSCILTFPHYQRQGYGRLLIEFSYLLTRTEGKIGTPETPLSDLGLISYRSYWKDVLINYLHSFTGKELSIKDMSQETGINSNDIVSTLQALSMIKYWKGKHIILKKQDVIDDYVERFMKYGRPAKNKYIESSLLKWVPRA